MKNPDHLSPRDLERLSAYLDGKCSSKQAAKLEARMRIEPGLRQTLEELRATAGLLRALPEVSPPRSFALTPEMVGIERRRPYPILRLATALASIAFVALIGVDALTTSLTPLASSVAPAADMRELGIQEEVPAEAPMMAAEPDVAPAEGNGILDEQERSFGEEHGEADLPPMTEEPALPTADPTAGGAERSEAFAGQAEDEADATLEATPKSTEKLSETPAPSTGTLPPEPTIGDAIDVEPADRTPGDSLAVLDWSPWRIGLRTAEIIFGAAALVFASLMLWTRRK
jgi:hypothetical protein